MKICIKSTLIKHTVLFHKRFQYASSVMQSREWEKSTCLDSCANVAKKFQRLFLSKI